MARWLDAATHWAVWRAREPQAQGHPPLSWFSQQSQSQWLVRPYLLPGW